MENGPFIDDVPIKTTIFRGFSMAMLNNQMVFVTTGAHKPPMAHPPGFAEIDVSIGESSMKTGTPRGNFLEFSSSPGGQLLDPSAFRIVDTGSDISCPNLKAQDP